MTIFRVLAALALSALVLVAAGCGGSKSPSVASLGSSGTTTTTTTSADDGGPSTGSGNDDFHRFVACMQRHGVKAQLAAGGHGVSISGGPKSSPLMERAQRACQKLLPGGGPKAMTPAQRAKMMQSLRALSRCMRSHGFPTFPDPSADGGLQLERSGGLDPRSPRFQSAMKTCSPDGKGGKGGIGFKVQARS
jgi:hypothetical protein